MAKAEKNAESMKNLIPFKKGKSGNPAGKAKGTEHYITKARRAFERIGKAKNMSAEEVEELMIESGLLEAIEKGNYNFYRDHMDRAHGKPLQKTALTDPSGEGAATININVVYE